MFLFKSEDKEKEKIFKVKYYNGKITQREGNTVRKCKEERSTMQGKAKE
jgi:hypothetical protein